MKWHGLRIRAVILAFIAGLLFLFGGQIVYKEIFYLKPLKEALNNKQLILSYQIKNERSIPEIYVELAETDDFKITYQKINNDITNIMQKQPYQLIIIDSRDDVLCNVFYKSQFIIYQAIARGAFQDMAFEIDKLAKTAGAKARLYIDQKNIYIQLKRGNKNLYEVIPRYEKPYSGDQDLVGVS